MPERTVPPEPGKLVEIAESKSIDSLIKDTRLDKNLRSELYNLRMYAEHYIEFYALWSRESRAGRAPKFDIFEPDEQDALIAAFGQLPEVLELVYWLKSSKDEKRINSIKNTLLKLLPPIIEALKNVEYKMVSQSKRGGWGKHIEKEEGEALRSKKRKKVLSGNGQ